MRAIVAAAILLLCVAPAATEPEHPSLPAGSSDRDGVGSIEALVKVEPTLITDDLENGAAAQMTDLHGASSAMRAQTPASPAPVTPAATAPTADAPDTNAPATNPAPPSAALPKPGEAQTAPTLPVDQICNALLTSAQDNKLPVAFFANLIWQESRLRDDAVSPKGALGIAQFMPKVAAEAGLANPFDPLQALPASARLLHDLRDQFGNLGFVAAAYNAGIKRVDEWLQHGRTLPRETRGYVMDITGRSVEQWKKAPPADTDLRFARRLPCRDVPTFAGLEQAQLQQLESEQAQATQAPAQKPSPKLQAGDIKVAANVRKPEPLNRDHIASARRDRIAAAKRDRIADAKREHLVETRRDRVAEARRDRSRFRFKPSRPAERERHHARLEARDRTRIAARGRHSRA